MRVFLVIGINEDRKREGKSIGKSVVNNVMYMKTLCPSRLSIAQVSGTRSSKRVKPLITRNVQ